MEKTYWFTEVKGKEQGKVIQAKAESPEEAIKKVGFTERIREYERFPTVSFKPMYEMYEDGNRWHTLYICR